MLIVLIALTLLIASVGAIYFLLRSMGQDGVEIAAPGSCKSGRCGVRNLAGNQAECRQEEATPFAGSDELSEVASADRVDAPAEQPGSSRG